MAAHKEAELELRRSVVDVYTARGEGYSPPRSRHRVPWRCRSTNFSASIIQPSPVFVAAPARSSTVRIGGNVAIAIGE